MAPKKNHEAILVILDVGPSSGVTCPNRKETFFERAKKCVIKIFQRKIFQKSSDYVGLILIGGKTDNQINKEHKEGCENIEEFIKHMIVPDWDCVSRLERGVNLTDIDGDWMEGLCVGINFLKNTSEHYDAMKIILLTTFATPVKSDLTEYVIEEMKEDNFDVELLVINDGIEQPEDFGCNTGHFSQANTKTAAQRQNEEMITKIVEETDGVLCHLENAEAQLLFFEKKKTNSRSWNCSLKIGSSLEIDVAAYLKISDAKLLDSWKSTSTVPESKIKQESKYFQNDKEIQVDIENLISGYMYGASVVAFDQKMLNMDYGGASLMCLGFSNKEYILPEHLSGKGCHTVVAQRKFKQPTAEKRFAALVTAMHEKNVVMVARKIYRKGLTPKLAALFPGFTSNGHAHFTMIECHFSEDTLDFMFPSLSRSVKHKPTEEQLNVMERLINAMDLTTAGDETTGNPEAFALNKTQNPVIQHMCHMIAHRAMHPEAPLPKVNEVLTELIDVPEKLKQNTKEIIEEAKGLFTLQNNKKPSKIEQLEERLKKVGVVVTDVSAESGQNGAEPELDDQDLQTHSVGTVTPAEDYLLLLKIGEPFAKISLQLEEVIHKLMFQSLTIPHDKILKAVMAYRQEAKDLRPFKYNDWVKTFKATTFTKGMINYFEDFIVKERQGLITSQDTEMSTVTLQEAEEFYSIENAIAADMITSVPDDNDDELMNLVE